MTLRLSQVTVERERRKPGRNTNNDMTGAFRAADGYTIEVSGGLLLISKDGECRVGSSAFIVDGIVAVDEPVTSPESPQAKASGK